MLVLPVSSALHRRALRGEVFHRALADWIDARDPVNTPTPSDRRADAASVPPLDVAETDAAYIATLDMPGVAKDQLEVSVEARRVVISTAAANVEASTDAAQAAAGDTPRALHTERTAPRYARTIVLPAELDAGAAQARMENGVLTLTLPKRIAGGAAKVTVQ